MSSSGHGRWCLVNCHCLVQRWPLHRWKRKDAPLSSFAEQDSILRLQPLHFTALIFQQPFYKRHHPGNHMSACDFREHMWFSDQPCSNPDADSFVQVIWGETRCMKYNLDAPGRAITWLVGWETAPLSGLPWQLLEIASHQLH